MQCEREALWVSFMTNGLGSPGSSSDLLHCVLFLGNSGHFVEHNGEKFHSC